MASLYRKDGRLDQRTTAYKQSQAASTQAKWLVLAVIAGMAVKFVRGCGTVRVGVVSAAWGGLQSLFSLIILPNLVISAFTTDLTLARCLKSLGSLVYVFTCYLLLAAGLKTMQHAAIGRRLHIAYGVVLLSAFALEGLAALIRSDTVPASALFSGWTAFAVAWPLFCLMWFGVVKRTTEPCAKCEPSASSATA